MLDTLQADLDTTTTARPIRIIGIDAVGHESDNAVICNGRTLPWLQDTAAAEVWRAWAANKDDVIVLDSTNVIIATYSVAAHDLTQSANYAALKNLLVTAAAR